MAAAFDNSPNKQHSLRLSFFYSPQFKSAPNIAYIKSKTNLQALLFFGMGHSEMRHKTSVNH